MRRTKQIKRKSNIKSIELDCKTRFHTCKERMLNQWNIADFLLFEDELYSQKLLALLQKGKLKNKWSIYVSEEGWLHLSVPSLEIFVESYCNAFRDGKKRWLEKASVDLVYDPRDKIVKDRLFHDCLTLDKEGASCKFEDLYGESLYFEKKGKRARKEENYLAEVIEQIGEKRNER